MTTGNETEAELLRLNRALRMLNSGNQALFKAESEMELLCDICQRIVGGGGYLMCWIGMEKYNDSNTIQRVYGCGKIGTYLEQLQSSWKKDGQSNSPAAAAIRTGTTQVNQDFINNPVMAPWRESAIEHGFRSSIALPLVDGNRVLGIISIYAQEADAFNSDEIALLEELTANLVFGIKTFRTRVRAREANKRLHESQEQYKRIVEMTDEGVWSIDAQRNTDFVNDAICRKLGYTSDEMLGRPVSDFVFEEDKEQIGQEINERTSGIRGKHEQRFRRKDGSELWAQVYGTPFKDKYGNFAGAFALISDITERKRLEEVERSSFENQAQYRVAIKTSPDGFWTVDLNGYLVDVNEAYARLSGYTINELIGMHVSQLDPVHDEAKVAARAEEVSKVGHARFETTHRRKDGSLWPVEVTAASSSIHGGRFFAFFTDLSERKHMEAELQRARELAYRDVLVREVHHRIKNNLQGVISVLRLGLDNDQPVSEIIDDAVGRIQSIAILHGLQGRSGNSRVAVCELVMSIAANSESMMRRKILCDIPTQWLVFTISEAESVPVALILNELIMNAIKHGSTENESINIHLRRGPDNESVVVTIYNSGEIPAGFGLDNPEVLGTGLQLVSSLMPYSGVTLIWEQDQRNRVATKLTLSSPNVQQESYYFSGEGNHGRREGNPSS